MSEIETFLQQLDETERLAKEAGGETWYWAFYSAMDEWRVRDRRTQEPRAEVTDDDRVEHRARHIAHWDPASVLRWVAAVREILAEHEPSTGDHNLRGEPIPPYCRCCSDSRGDYSEAWPCPTVRALMSVYQEEGS